MPRGTRRIILDHVDKSIGHLENAVGQLRVAMETGEDRSKECYFIIPKIIEAILQLIEWIKAMRERM